MAGQTPTIVQLAKQFNFSHIRIFHLVQYLEEMLILLLKCTAEISRLFRVSTSHSKQPKELSN